MFSSAALPGKKGISSICGAVITGAIYFCSILFPCSPASRETSKYEVVVYSFPTVILLLSYGVRWNLPCRRFRQETIAFLPAYHIQCCRFPCKKVPPFYASATEHNALYTCQVPLSKRYRENPFQNWEAILPCFQYKIQCCVYFSCLFTCISAVSSVLLNILE